MDIIYGLTVTTSSRLSAGANYTTLTRKVYRGEYNVHYMLLYMLSNFSQPCLENEMGPQADGRSETIHTAKRANNTCICSSLHVQGMFTYTDSHRCPLHYTMEHDCTSKNIIPGLIVSNDTRLDTPQAVEDRCICSSLHIHGNLLNIRYYHRCPVHNDTAEHNCMHTNISLL